MDASVVTRLYLSLRFPRRAPRWRGAKRLGRHVVSPFGEDSRRVGDRQRIARPLTAKETVATVQGPPLPAQKLSATGKRLRLAQGRGQDDALRSSSPDRRARHSFIHVRSPIPTRCRSHHPRLAGSIFESSNVDAHRSDRARRTREEPSTSSPVDAGYGFSPSRAESGGPDHIAASGASHERLGYTRYVAQGGDWVPPFQREGRQAQRAARHPPNLTATVPPPRWPRRSRRSARPRGTLREERVGVSPS